MIDESLDVKEVVYSAERVSFVHDDDLVSIAAPSTGLSGELSVISGVDRRQEEGVWECVKISPLRLIAFKSSFGKVPESPFFCPLFIFFNSFFQAKALLVICAWLHVCHVNVYECTL